MPFSDEPKARMAATARMCRAIVATAEHGLLRVVDPEDVGRDEAHDVLDLALRLLEDAARRPVEGMVGVPEPLTAVMDAVNVRAFDDVIVSTLPTRASRWLRLDLPHKVGGGLAKDRPSVPVAPLAPTDATLLRWVRRVPS